MGWTLNTKLPADSCISSTFLKMLLYFFLMSSIEAALVYRHDNRCGGDFMASDGIAAACNPYTSACCSPYNWCGDGEEYCGCIDCVDFRAFREDKRCGGRFEAPNGDVARCDPRGGNPCCSPHNWCGNTAEFCDCDGCMDYRVTMNVRFRDDYRCGGGFIAPNGHVAECDPTGPSPCCSPHNWCGYGVEFCGCEECVDYRDFRQDLRCGAGFKSPNGKVAICNPSGAAPCCSPSNWCGNTEEYCNCEGCIDFRGFRDDLRCGGTFVAPNGRIAGCNPLGGSPCCSPRFWCGSTDDFCKCEGCVDFRGFREDNRCGGSFVAPNGQVAQCNPSGPNPCCSPHNWCGNTIEYCGCQGCVNYRESSESFCPADVTAVTAYGNQCTSVCWDESTGTDGMSSPPVTYRSHEPSHIFSVGRTEVTYLHNDTTANRITECRFNVTVEEACVSGTIDAITRTSDGHTYMFVGDLVMRLTDDGKRIADGYPKPICAVFPGLPSYLDAAVHWPNGKTYFFKGPSYWASMGTSVVSTEPESIVTDFKGIPSNIDAVIIWGKNDKAYFFRGRTYWRFNVINNLAETLLPNAISSGWPGTGNTVDAAFQWSDGLTYFFTGENYWRYNDTLDAGENGYPKRTSQGWLGCTSTMEYPSTVSADTVCIPQVCSESSASSCYLGNFDAITHIDIGGSRGNIFIFRGMMVIKLTEASGDIEYGFPKPICSVFPGLPSNIDAALTWKDTGETYFFKGDLCYRFKDFRLDRGFPQAINTAFPGIPFDIDAAVVTGHDGNQQTFFFKDDMFYEFDRGTGRVAAGYPQAIQDNWSGLPNNIQGALQWINNWTYFFKGERFFRWDFVRKTVPEGYPRQISKTWFGCSPSGERNSCWVRQCSTSHDQLKGE